MNTTIYRFARKGSLVVLAVLIVAFAFSSGHAQMAVTNTADATVLAAISLTADANLEFGNVFQGVPKTVARTATGADTTAGIFTITGEAGAGISAQLILPEYMSSTNGDIMTVTFGTTDMAIDTTTTADPSSVTATEGWIDEDPRSFPSGLVVGGTTPAVNTTKIYLGGKVIPSVFQPAGTYTADVILSVSYNGN